MSDKSVQSLSLTEPYESQGGFWERRRVPVSHVPLETVTKATAVPGIPVLLSQVSIISGDESFRILWALCMKRRRVQKQWANTTTQGMTVGTLGQNQQLECWKDGTEEHLFLFGSKMWSATECRARTLFPNGSSLWSIGKVEQCEHWQKGGHLKEYLMVQRRWQILNGSFWPFC